MHSPNPVKINDMTLSIASASQGSVTVTVHLTLAGTPPSPRQVSVRAEAREVGWDGSRPESPVAVAPEQSILTTPGTSTSLDLSLAIGTPFLWSSASPCTYVAEALIEPDGTTACEVRFRLLSAGAEVTVERLTKPTPVPVIPRPGDAALPSLFIAGDSTGYSNGKNQAGWGDKLAAFSDPARITIRNRARPGRSARSFRREGLWKRVLAELRAGDIVVIQFGHNDADTLAEGRCRGVLPGTGSETREVVMPDGNRETVYTFGWYLRHIIDETRSKGAIPVLMSPTAKNEWNAGRLTRPQSPYGEWSAAVAAACGVAYIDLTARIADRYDALGQDKVQALFCSVTDNVHTSPEGASLNASEAAAGLNALRLLEFPATK